VLLLALGTYFLVFFCPKGRISYCNYKQIENGMTIQEVTEILGPGEEIEAMYVSRTREGPVVWGDQFFNWDTANGRLGNYTHVLVGLKGGKVCSKHWWEPSP
jgi:hypothetical protein